MATWLGMVSALVYLGALDDSRDVVHIVDVGRGGPMRRGGWGICCCAEDSITSIEGTCCY